MAMISPTREKVTYVGHSGSVTHHRAARLRFVLGLIAVVATLAFMAWVSPGAAAQTTTTDQEATVIEVTGIVTVDGVPVPSGIDLAFVSVNDETVVCGTTKTGANGRFAFTIGQGCLGEQAYAVRLVSLDLSSASRYMIDPAVTQISADFTGLTDVELASLGVTEEAQAGDSPQTEALLEKWTLTIILMTVIVATALVLMFLMFKATGGSDVRKQTEAMILVGVIIAIILLGVTGKVGSDGLVSVLAAIVGWTAARATTTQ